ncbi:MAG: hypothetical protein KJ919_00715, partial [Verrucomicrobia bacterium]|nr:hypothetical protein [Verrucomicrobiota bacterium]MBU4290304.1 hypothetical protein [Verrucomicrobiota bacterium]
MRLSQGAKTEGCGVLFRVVSMALGCVALVGAARAADIIYYSQDTIVLNSGTATLADIHKAVNNPSVLSKTSDELLGDDEYVLTANMKVNASAILIIDGCTLKFNEPSHNKYGLSNYGEVKISKATLTSST